MGAPDREELLKMVLLAILSRYLLCSDTKSPVSSGALASPPRLAPGALRHLGTLRWLRLRLDISREIYEYTILIIKDNLRRGRAASGLSCIGQERFVGIILMRCSGGL